MKQFFLSIASLALFCFTACQQQGLGSGDSSKKDNPSSVYDFTVSNNQGEDVDLSVYRGKVLLFVNTATQCGFTPQYEGLQTLYAKYRDKGFVVLDFPCNQFGQQAPGSDDEIQSFCVTNYNTEFPRFKKIDVNGDNRAQVYDYLINAAPGDSSVSDLDIKWNFTKFLVSKDGAVLQRFESGVTCDEMEPAIIKALEE